MITFGWGACGRGRSLGFFAVMAVCVTLFATNAAAQTQDNSFAATVAVVAPEDGAAVALLKEPGPDVRTGDAPVSIRRSIERIGQDPAVGLTRDVSPAAPAAQKRERSVWRRIAGGAVGGVGGFFGGGYLGAAIEGDDCGCDDPGFKGAVIGASIGAVAGAIAGALFLF